MAATTIDPTPSAGGDRPAGKAKAGASAPVADRVFWRAVVRSPGPVSASGDRGRVEWHLAACTAPSEASHHCTEGRHLIETTGHPDGHCIIGGVCGLCGAPERPSAD